MSTMEEKLDSLIASVASLLMSINGLLMKVSRPTKFPSNSNLESWRKSLLRLRRTSLRPRRMWLSVLSNVQRGSGPWKFRNKGQQEQFSFNSKVADQNVIAERQKHIRIADQSPHHWKMVGAYKKALLAGSKEEDKRWKATESKMHCRRSSELMPRLSLRCFCPFHNFLQWSPQWPVRPPNGPLPPPLMSTMPMIGLCFQCGMIGHLKCHCPRRASQQYPFQNVTECVWFNGSDMVDFMCMLNSSDAKVVDKDTNIVCRGPNRLAKFKATYLLPCNLWEDALSPDNKLYQGRVATVYGPPPKHIY